MWTAIFTIGAIVAELIIASAIDASVANLEKHNSNLVAAEQINTERVAQEQIRKSSEATNNSRSNFIE